MANELSGVLVLNEISEDDGSTWKTIICETESTISGTNSSSTTQTKCGPKTVTSNEPTTISGSGVSQANLDSDEMSYQRLQQLRYDRSTIRIRRQNAADVSLGITAGELEYAEFDGLVTEVTATANSTDAVTFTWAVTSTDTPDFDVAS